MSKHVLVIDDEERIRDLILNFLTRKGYRVSVSAGGDAALALVAEDLPDLVICDLQMDDMDGLMLIDRIKAIQSTLPVLLLTGVYFDGDVLRDNILSRVSGYLSKTAPLQTVLAEVKRLTD
jgi:CheY-like chemotaxis protein